MQSKELEMQMDTSRAGKTQAVAGRGSGCCVLKSREWVRWDRERVNIRKRRAPHKTHWGKTFRAWLLNVGLATFQ